MDAFLQLVLSPFAWLMTFFHNTLGSYGLAMIFFALVVKVILFPLSLKGKRSMIQMTMLSGQMQKIQTQYARNREKMNEELQKLYAKEKVKPMSGCLWTMIPVIILIPLYALVRRPFHYIMFQTKESMVAIADTLGFTVNGVAPTVENISSGYNELTVAGMITEDNLSAVKAAADGVAAGLGENVLNLNFSFLGLDLSQIPNWKIWEGPFTWGVIGLFLIPIIATGMNYLSMVITQKTNSLNKQTQQSGQMAAQMKIMTFTMPIMSLFFCFVMPAAMGIYWIVNSVLTMVQELICNRLLRKDYARAAAAKAEQERLEKEEEKRKRREAAERRAQAIEEAKLNKGKKKKPVEKPEKKKPATTDAGRIGMRPYARGRSYDPDRYGGVTPYRDPNNPVDEQAISKALQAKSERLEEQAVSDEADALIVEELAQEIEASQSEQEHQAGQETERSEQALGEDTQEAEQSPESDQAEDTEKKTEN